MRACRIHVQMARKYRLGKQCEAITRSGQRCSITEATTLIDRNTGVLVSEPLRRGSRFCFYHMETMVRKPLPLLHDLEFVLLDLETTGLSITQDRIVEIAALDMHGAVFATVINPCQPVTAHAVHGISNQELMDGPTFPEAYWRFLTFLQILQRRAVVEDSDSSADGEGRIPSLRGPVPCVILIAHNGFRFDFPLVLAECLRHNLQIGDLSACGFVDSLMVMQAIEALSFGCH